MRLRLYSSIGDQRIPNLVSVQNAGLDFLPTILVCPIRKDAAPTGLRGRFEWRSEHYTVLCELVRPIRASALVLVGEINEAASEQVMARLRLLFA